MSLLALVRDLWNRARPRWVVVIFIVVFVEIVVFGIILLQAQSTPFTSAWNTANYLAIEAISAALVGLRVLINPRERPAWAFMFVALASLTLGDAIESLSVPFGVAQPNADVSQYFYVAFVLFFVISLWLAARRRMRSIPVAVWLDGLIAAFGLLAVVSYIVVQPEDEIAGAVLIELLYIAAPLLFLATLLSALAMLDRYPGVAWTLQTTASVLMVTSNIVLVPTMADGTYLIGQPIDVLWPLATALLALSAWFPPGPPAAEGPRVRAIAVAPAAFSIGVLGILVINELGSGSDITEYFAFASLAAGLVRLLLLVTDAERHHRREARLNSELEKARDEALAAARAKTAFLATMSHEIRTPLSAVLGLNSLLFETDLSDIQRQYAEKVAHNGALLLELITDILDFSKIDAGAVELERRPFDLRALVTNSTAVLSYVAESKHLRLITDISPECPQFVVGDVTRLRQVLVNLISNAVKFTSVGKVIVTAVPGDAIGSVRFDVTDTGIGIESEQLDGLFSPFTQADVSTTRLHGGTGLGLSICSSLVELMGGHITVTSSPGIGSTFSFEVQLESTTAAVGAEDIVLALGRAPEPTIAADASDSLRILVAEDNSSLQLLSTLFITRLGHDVDAVETGVAAVDAVTTGNYDVVLMDVHMPLMDGIEATMRIRDAGAAIAQPRIIALTASATLQDRDACLAAGMDYYLAKPFTIQDLRSALIAVQSVDGAEHVSVEREKGMSFEYLDELPREVRDDILRNFIERGNEDFVLLERAVAAKDAETVQFVAHKMRGSALVVGANSLADMFLALERHEGDEASDRVTIARARAALDLMVRAIELELRGNQ